MASLTKKANSLKRINSNSYNILESIGDGFAAIDRNWNYIYINHEAASLTQLSREELIGKNLLKIHPNFSKSIFYRKYKEAMDRNKTLRFESYFPSIKAWFLINVYPTTNGLSVLFSDITAIKKYADQLSAEKAKSDATLASIGEGVITTDNHGRIEVVNAQAEAMLGFQADEIVGKDFESVWSVEDDLGRRLPRQRRLVTIALTQHKKITRTKNYFVTERRRFPATATAAPILVGHTIRGVVVVFRDTHKEREVDRAKSEFVSMASHQLRTPLTAIKLFSEMLQQQSESKLDHSTIKNLIKNIHEANEKMIHLVNNLLDVSRMESGRLKFKWEATDLKEQIRKVIADITPLASEKSISTHFNSTLKKAPLTTDPALFRQVILNLVTNAIFYSKPKSEPIVISLEKESAKNYLLSVRDQGIGIPRDSQRRIFERFYRAENAIQAKADGSGLGLYMSKMIIEKLQGKIWLSSEPGRGTTFYISLPITTRKTS